MKLRNIAKSLRRTSALWWLLCFYSILGQSQTATYTFIGRYFNDYYNTNCPPVCRLAGSFSLDEPLPPNLVGNIGGDDFTPVLFSFSDGLSTVTNLDATTAFAVSTNKFAGITDFSFDLYSQDRSLEAYFNGSGNNSTYEDTVGYSYYALYVGSYQNNGGGWTSKYQQNSHPWGPWQYDDSDTTIAKKGCALTSLAMAANIAKGGAGAAWDPGSLNKQMVEDGDYSDSGDVIWDRVARSLGFIWIVVNTSDDRELAQNLQSSGEAIVVAVPSVDKSCNVTADHKHFVLATGAISDGNGGYTITINDPYCSSHITLDAYPSFTSRGYFYNFFNTFNQGQKLGTVDLSGLTVWSNETVEMSLLSPDGKRTGFTHSGDLFEIPNSSYSRDSITDDDSGDDPTPITHYLGINSPSGGNYILILTGIASGTYTLNVDAYSSDGASEPPVTTTENIAPGQTFAYQLTYNPQPGSQVMIGPRISASIQ